MKNICAQTIFEGLTAVETSEIFINTRQSIRLAVVTIDYFSALGRGYMEQTDTVGPSYRRELKVVVLKEVP